jgi:glycosyltransferase involved in cell wall biosynthesis
VIPSRYEPYGQVCLEARAAGRLIIISDVDGLPEQLSEGACGYICDFDDPGSFSDAIAGILKMSGENPEEIRRLVSQGRRPIKEAFPRYLRLLSELILTGLGDRQVSRK